MGMRRQRPAIVAWIVLTGPDASHLYAGPPLDRRSEAMAEFEALSAQGKPCIVERHTWQGELSTEGTVTRVATANMCIRRRSAHVPSARSVDHSPDVRKMVGPAVAVPTQRICHAPQPE